jgi:hypothetical protein
VAIRYRSYDDGGAAVADMLDALLGHGRASLTGTPPDLQGQRRGSVAPAALVGRERLGPRIQRAQLGGCSGQEKPRPGAGRGLGKPPPV